MKIALDKRDGEVVKCHFHCPIQSYVMLVFGAIKMELIFHCPVKAAALRIVELALWSGHGKSMFLGLGALRFCYLSRSPRSEQISLPRAENSRLAATAMSLSLQRWQLLRNNA